MSNTIGIINWEERNGNLHLKPEGEFCVEVAQELASTMSSSYRGQGNIFIHTRLITGVAPRSREMFNNMVRSLNLPRRRIFLMGELGKDICHDEGRVIISKPRKPGRRCGGKCGGCGSNTKLQ